MKGSTRTVGVAVKLLKVREVAERLGLTPETVYGMIADGKIPSVRVGRRYLRVRQDHLDSWIDRNTRVS
jgi:excisionase family DNA binding protein